MRQWWTPWGSLNWVQLEGNHTGPTGLKGWKGLWFVTTDTHVHPESLLILPVLLIHAISFNINISALLKKHKFINLINWKGFLRKLLRFSE